MPRPTVSLRSRSASPFDLDEFTKHLESMPCKENGGVLWLKDDDGDDFEGGDAKSYGDLDYGLEAEQEFAEGDGWRLLDDQGSGDDPADAPAETLNIEIDGMGTRGLREVCRSKGLTVRGTKDQLLKRLKEHDASPDERHGADQAEWSARELREACKSKGLKVRGTKDSLLKRLREHDGAGDQDSEFEGQGEGTSNC